MSMQIAKITNEVDVSIVLWRLAVRGVSKLHFRIIDNLFLTDTCQNTIISKRGPIFRFIYDST